MVTFILIRHGYSKGNKEKIFTGQLDLPLDEVGVAQAKATAKYISENYRIDRIYSSDLSRACETARPLAEATGLEILPCKELRETDFGKWQGMLIADVAKEFPEDFAEYKAAPGLSMFGGAECYATVMKRASEAIDRIAAENDGKTVVISTHGGVIRSLRAAWQNVELKDIKQIPHVPNSSVTVLDYDVRNKKAEYKLTGYIDHLPDKITEENFN